MLTRYARFSGRAARSEFWWWWLACVLLGVAAGVVDLVVTAVVGFSALNLLLALALFLPTLAVTVRRLHDSDLSGWWVLLLYGLGLASGVALVVGLLTLLLGLLDSATGDEADGGSGLFTGGVVVLLVAAVLGLVAGITWLVMMLRPSTPGENRYGPAPQQPVPPVGWAPPAWSPPADPWQEQPYGAPAGQDETQPLRRPPG